MVPVILPSLFAEEVGATPTSPDGAACSAVNAGTITSAALPALNPSLAAYLT
ncbi:hypothetical protein D3C71_2002940 [compost metagenome]